MSDRRAGFTSFPLRYYRTGLLLAASGLSAWGGVALYGLLSIPGMIWAAALGMVVGSLAMSAMRIGRIPEDLQPELALAAVLPIQGLTQISGGLFSPWMPAYAALLLVTSFIFGWRANAVVVGATVVLESLPVAVSRVPLDSVLTTGLIWWLFLGLIPVTVKGFMRASVREHRLLKDALDRMTTSARTIVPSPDVREKQQVHSLTREDRLDRIMPLSQRFEDVVENLLWILKNSLKSSRKCLLYLPERPDLEKLALRRLVGEEARNPAAISRIAVGEGLLGWIAKEQKPVRLGRLDQSRDPVVESLTGTEKVRSLLAMPIVSEGVLEGLVVADSPAPEAFSEDDEGILVLVCHEILRALHDLRDRGRAHSKAFEFSTLLEVSRALSSKLDLGHRLETMAEKVKQIIPYDHCFIFLVDEGERRARLAVARGQDRPEPETGSFALRDGFLSMVVKNRQALLMTDLHDKKRRLQLFPSGCRIQVSPASFLGLPMKVEDRVIGVFTITAKKPDAFDGHDMDFLETLCHQAALSVSDAQLHDQVARLATSDGLTGVLNHRKFQEKLAGEFERQDRERGNFSVIMLDVDHFKNINDTYGHPVGDQVLKKLAAILSRMVRKIDTVARYGGEEFSLLLPNAGGTEALKLAERIRASIEEARFETGTVAIPVTVSMGVAVFPRDTRKRQELIDRADQALYAAKKGGRNRVCAYGDVESRS